MVAPAPTASSSSLPSSPPPPPQGPGNISYLDTTSHPSSSYWSPSPSPSQLNSESPTPPKGAPLTREPSDLRYHHHRKRLDSYQYDPPSFSYGPLPRLHDLVLPPIGHSIMSTAISPNALPLQDAAPRMSMTSREWVIPPRPKPGRKPATDTPPTKRKAQNRAAQRAFRERRAARVGELEEQLEQQKSSHDKDEATLNDKVRSLELELQSFRSRCLLLENMLERERKERIRAETELESQKRRESESYSRSGSISVSHNTLRPINQRRNLPDHRGEPAESVLPSLEGADGSLTCGNCSGGSCACAEEAMNSVTSALGEERSLKRASSPSAPMSSDKRHRPEPLTSNFSRQEESIHPADIDTISFKDGCGFCKEGTYCACADAAMATPAMTPTDTLPPILSQTQTPPPSEPDSTPHSMIMEMTADGAVKLPRRSHNHTRPKPVEPTSRGCGANGPGTCAQCQADPKSGLFCRLMAAKFNREQGGSSGGGCCGGKGAGGGCCKSTPSNQQQPKQQQQPQPEKITLPSLPSLGLSCAEAYQTLASHRHFDKASDDIGSWLPKLRATPGPSGSSTKKIPSRMPMPVEVEAASIMSVLKDFDVRFGE